MPTLDLQSSHDYWKAYHDPMIYRVVQFMEAMEFWTADGNPVFETTMKALETALDETKKFVLAKEKELIALAANLKATRFLRLLQALDQDEPGSASKLLMFAEKNSAGAHDMSSIFLRRNMVFERLRLIARIFSSERIALLIKTLEGDTGDA